jgi:predicted house-cleaning noncanonical NTP pyrophosphatase (MazG superfamily)
MKKITILLILGVCGLSFYHYILYTQKNQEKIEIVVEDAPGQVKMKKYRLNKLWRDNAASQLEMHDGAIIHRSILNDEEYSRQLGLKAQEEIEEVIAAQNKQELAEEIGDVLEVLDCIIAFNNLDLQEIKAIQDAKRQTRGSYRAREFVTIAEAVPGSFLHQYYLKSPDRHQEIID